MQMGPLLPRRVNAKGGGKKLQAATLHVRNAPGERQDFLQIIALSVRLDFTALLSDKRGVRNVSWDCCVLPRAPLYTHRCQKVKIALVTQHEHCNSLNQWPYTKFIPIRTKNLFHHKRCRRTWNVLLPMLPRDKHVSDDSIKHFVGQQIHKNTIFRGCRPHYLIKMSPY